MAWESNTKIYCGKISFFKYSTKHKKIFAVYCQNAKQNSLKLCQVAANDEVTVAINKTQNLANGKLDAHISDLSLECSVIHL